MTVTTTATNDDVNTGTTLLPPVKKCFQKSSPKLATFVKCCSVPEDEESEVLSNNEIMNTELQEAPGRDITASTFDSGGGDNTMDSNEHGGRVSFGEVRIRQHERILNTRPSCNFADLTLGWRHHSSIRQNLDDYEQQKEVSQQQQQSSSSSTMKTSSCSLSSSSLSSMPTATTSCSVNRITGPERLQKLNEYGYTAKEVLRLEKEKKQAIRQRKKDEEQQQAATKKKKNNQGGMIFSVVGGIKLFRKK